MISGVRFVGMCDVLSDSLYPAFTAAPILHLDQSLNPTPDSIDCISVVTVASFEVPTGRSGKIHLLSSYYPRMSEADNDDLIWNTDSSTVEIRFQGRLEDGRPALDELVANGADVHLEQMNHDQWWMGIQSGGKDFHLWFTVEDGRLCVRLSDQDDENAHWEGDNREKPLPGADA